MNIARYLKESAAALPTALGSPMALTATQKVNARSNIGIETAADIDSTAGGTFEGDDVETILEDHEGRIVDLEGEINPAVQIHAATAKTTPVDADEFGLADSAASYGLKKFTWASFKAAMFAALGALTVAGTAKPAIVDADRFIIADSEAGNSTKTFSWASLKARLLSQTVIRELLTANRTYYVRTDGSDANNGLANTSGGAFLTVQKAIDVASSLDMGIYSVTISIGAGTFSQALQVKGNGNTRITLSGAGYASTTIGSGAGVGIQNYGGAEVTLNDINVNGGTVGIWARYGGQITVTGTVQVSGGTARLVGTDFGGIFTMNSATLRLNADSAYALYCANLGAMQLSNGATIKTTAARTFTYTVRCASAGVVSMTASLVTWDVSSGAVTGGRYIATLNGVIDTVTGGGASFIPGSTSGSTATGGQYA